MTPYAFFHNQREYENAQPGLAEYALIAPKSFFAAGGLKYPVAPFTAAGDEIIIKTAHVFKAGLGFLYFVAAPDKNELNTTTTGEKGFRRQNTEVKLIFPGSTPAQHEQLRKLLNTPLVAIVKDGQCAANMHYQLGTDCTAAYLTSDFKSGTSEGGIKGFEVTLTYADAPLFYAAAGPTLYPDPAPNPDPDPDPDPEYLRPFYVSNSGSESNDGLTPEAPITMDIVNSLLLEPGDAVLFNRGETFSGTLNITRNGNADNDIVFGAYGTGARPVLTGFSLVEGWTNVGGNIWESDSAVSALDELKLVTINGVHTPMGRWPKGDSTYPFMPNFVTFESVDAANNKVTSAGLSGQPDWSGAEAVFRQNQWTIGKGTVLSQVGNVLEHTALTGELSAGYGFFIQNDARTLTAQNDWYFDPVTKKLRIYSTTAPVNVQVATVANVVHGDYGSPTQSYIDINGLEITGSNDDCLYLNGIGNLTIQNCRISHAGESTIYLTGQNYVEVIDNEISDSGYHAIFHSNGTNATIMGNTVKRIGLVTNFIAYHYDGAAVLSRGSNSLYQYNVVEDCALSGIGFRGSNVSVLNNFVRRACLQRGDSAGIYTAHPGETEKLIEGNIILDTVGNFRGTPDTTSFAFGIYLDDLATDTIVRNNTVANCNGTGLFLHNINNCDIEGNTFFNNGLSSGWTPCNLFVQNDSAEYQGLSRGNLISDNIMFSKSAAFCIRYYCQDETNLIDDFGSLDNNVYAKPLNAATACQLWQDGGTLQTLDLASWKTLTAKDASSTEAPLTITEASDVRFEYNATNAPVTITLAENYVTPKNVIHYGSEILPPWSSIILIRDTRA